LDYIDNTEIHIKRWKWACMTMLTENKIAKKPTSNFSAVCKQSDGR
jgi:hypothetical protein